MKPSLRKGKCHIHVTYKNGGFTNNLWASNLTLEVHDDMVVLEMDLSSNFHVRNKSSNSYLDAVELSEQRSQIAMIQLDGAVLLEPLSNSWKQLRTPKLVVVLFFADKSSIQYEAKPKALEISVQLTMLRIHA